MLSQIFIHPMMENILMLWFRMLLATTNQKFDTEEKKVVLVSFFFATFVNTNSNLVSCFEYILYFHLTFHFSIVKDCFGQ